MAGMQIVATPDPKVFWLIGFKWNGAQKQRMATSRWRVDRDLHQQDI